MQPCGWTWLTVFGNNDIDEQMRFIICSSGSQSSDHYYNIAFRHTLKTAWITTQRWNNDHGPCWLCWYWYQVYFSLYYSTAAYMCNRTLYQKMKRWKDYFPAAEKLILTVSLDLTNFHLPVCPSDTGTMVNEGDIGSNYIKETLHPSQMSFDPSQVSFDPSVNPEPQSPYIWTRSGHTECSTTCGTGEKPWGMTQRTDIHIENPFFPNLNVDLRLPELAIACTIFTQVKVQIIEFHSVFPFPEKEN